MSRPEARASNSRCRGESKMVPPFAPKEGAKNGTLASTLAPEMAANEEGCRGEASAQHQHRGGLGDGGSEFGLADLGELVAATIPENGGIATAAAAAGAGFAAQVDVAQPRHAEHDAEVSPGIGRQAGVVVQVVVEEMRIETDRHDPSDLDLVIGCVDTVNGPRAVGVVAAEQGSRH